MYTKYQIAKNAPTFFCQKYSNYTFESHRNGSTPFKLSTLLQFKKINKSNSYFNTITRKNKEKTDRIFCLTDHFPMSFCFFLSAALLLLEVILPFQFIERWYCEHLCYLEDFAKMMNFLAPALDAYKRQDANKFYGYSLNIVISCFW